MNVYFAPLEGITTVIYRNTHAALFGECDGYYAPFITPSDHEKISRKGLRDVLPEKNLNQALKVQVLTNKASSFLKFVEKIRGIGYREVNLNLGCPFERVVAKGRGAGFLCHPKELDSFFEEVFSGTDMSISVKTRTGFASGAEMDALLAIYNRYPLSQLIVHPRTRADFYKGLPDMAVFDKVYEKSNNPLCYNGDITCVEDYQRIAERYTNLEGIMIGRGVIQNPALFREIKGGHPLQTEELLIFSKKLADNYYQELGSETFTLHKLKEVWAYMLQQFPEEKKIAKAIKKAGTLAELMKAASYLPTR